MSTATTHIETEKQFVPAMRFKEFEREWSICKMEDVADKITDGTHFSPKLYEEKEGNYLYITSKNVKNGYMDFSKISYVKEDAHNDIYKRCDVKKGDVLLTKDGTIGQVRH
jgi:type I restriction enzyme S subunit